MSREFGSSAEIRFSMLFFWDCHCQAPPVIASASTANSAASDRPANITRRRVLGFFGGAMGSAAGSPTRFGPMGSARARRNERKVGKLVGVGNRGDDLGVRVGQVHLPRRRRRRGPKLVGLPRRLSPVAAVAAVVAPARVRRAGPRDSQVRTR